MALFAGTRHAQPLRGIMVLSGYEVLGARARRRSSEANRKTPLLFCHGTYDPMVQRGAGARRLRRLRRRPSGGGVARLPHGPRGLGRGDRRDTGWLAPASPPTDGLTSPSCRLRAVRLSVRSLHEPRHPRPPSSCPRATSPTFRWTASSARIRRTRRRSRWTSCSWAEDRRAGRRHRAGAAGQAAMQEAGGDAGRGRDRRPREGGSARRRTRSRARSSTRRRCASCSRS